jgi:hypothetical protein
MFSFLFIVGLSYGGEAGFNFYSLPFARFAAFDYSIHVSLHSGQVVCDSSQLLIASVSKEW